MGTLEIEAMWASILIVDKKMRGSKRVERLHKRFFHNSK